MAVAALSNSTTAPGLNGIVWANWNYATTTTTASTSQIIASTAIANQVWANWCQQTGGTWLIVVPQHTPTAATWAGWNTAYTETREQREAREQAQAQALLRQEEARQATLAAKERALELLGYVLSPQQMATYRDHGYFEVTSSKGRRWRIRDRGQSGNVDLMPEIGEERLASYCAHPPGALPDPDAHLAQALQLVTDEDAFLAVANRHYRRPAA